MTNIEGTAFGLTNILPRQMVIGYEVQTVNLCPAPTFHIDDHQTAYAQRIIKRSFFSVADPRALQSCYGSRLVVTTALLVHKTLKRVNLIVESHADMAERHLTKIQRQLLLITFFFFYFFVT